MEWGTHSHFGSTETGTFCSYWSYVVHSRFWESIPHQSWCKRWGFCWIYQSATLWRHWLSVSFFVSRSYSMGQIIKSVCVCQSVCQISVYLSVCSSVSTLSRISWSIFAKISTDVRIRDCNPGTLFQSQDFGIDKCQSRDPGIESRDWVPDFELVKISSNSLVVVSWWVLEAWSIYWSPVLTYYYANNCKYFYLSSFLLYDTISPLFNVKRNLLIFVKIQDRNLFGFVFKVVKIVKFSAIIGPYWYW